MQENQIILDDILIFRGCASFGMDGDAATKTLYPSPYGTCHAVKTPTSIDIEYQKMYCLQSQHETCPIFMQARARSQHQQAPEAGGRIIGGSAPGFSGRSARVAGLVILIICLVGLGFWFVRQDNAIVFAQVNRPTSAETTFSATAIPTQSIEKEPKNEASAVEPVAAPTEKPTEQPTVIATEAAVVELSSPTPAPTSPPPPSLPSLP